MNATADLILLPPAMPDWSSVRSYGGYQQRAGRKHAFAAAVWGCSSACSVHGHAHAWAAATPVSDDRVFWGALGCSCWAF